MSFMSKILGILGLPGFSWFESTHLAVKMGTGIPQDRLENAAPKRSWFSGVEEKDFRSKQQEYRVGIESAARIPLAR
jgi:hypothetical protein